LTFNEAWRFEIYTIRSSILAAIFLTKMEKPITNSSMKFEQKEHREFGQNQDCSKNNWEFNFWSI
jgi:hypothetical protein